MKQKIVVIGDVSFPSKTAATQAIRVMLYRYCIGATVVEADAVFLTALLARHPEAASKFGCGIASFQVEQNFGSRGFWLTRLDGTRTDWSFIACLSPPTHAQEVQKAFRYAVRDQIQYFKVRAFARAAVLYCPITREPLTLDAAHVDHDPPFECLVNSFLADAGIQVTDLAVQQTCDGDTDTRFVDSELALQWASYHAERAGLRLVTRRANLSILRQFSR